MLANRSEAAGPSNKRMKLTKLSPAPFRGRRCRLMPAPARMDAGTASQLIRGVRQTTVVHPRGNGEAAERNLALRFSLAGYPSGEGPA
jgi:hypothetical protein